MRTAFFILFVAVVLGATACRSSGPISRSIAVTVERGPGTRLVLTENAEFKWDRVCIFGPYTPDEQVDAIMGFSGAAARAFDIRSNDGINVLIFIEAGRVVDSVAHARGRGDFGPEVVGKCYSKEQAVFAVRKPPLKSWGDIGPL